MHDAPLPCEWCEDAKIKCDCGANEVHDSFDSCLFFWQEKWRRAEELLASARAISEQRAAEIMELKQCNEFMEKLLEQVLLTLKKGEI